MTKELGQLAKLERAIEKSKQVVKEIIARYDCIEPKARDLYSDGYVQGLRDAESFLDSAIKEYDND